MASEPIASTISASPLVPLQAWLARLGLSGKVLGISGLVGVLAVFLPLLSVSVQVPSGPLSGAKGGAALPALGMSQSVSVIQDWRGVICLIGYVAILVLTYVLYLPTGLPQKWLGWAGAGAGAFVALLALWLFIGAFNGSSSLSGFGASLKVSVGIGAILNLLAALAMTAGGFLKAREEKLI